ncbi:MAG: EAL domain-containing protein [Acidimicrobiales bacterium]
MQPSHRPAELADELAAALDNGELSVVYQPLVAVDDTETVAFEALLRWHSPRFGEIPPSEFVPVAERTELIVPIGRWVLEEACRQLMIWREEFPFRDLSVSVNMAAVQLLHPEFELLIREVLVLTGVDPRALQVELTQAVFDASPLVAERVAFLRSLGVAVALDDLDPDATGPERLGDYGVDVIKIDRHFIERLAGNRAGGDRLTSLVDRAHELAMSVTAVGVEDAAQLDELLEGRVERAQGFFFARPLEAAAVVPFLASEASLPASL